MSFTNQTPHYGLPQYIATDVPTILQDLNGAYQNIDEKIYEAKQAGDTASGDVNTLTTRVAGVETDVASVDAKADANTSAIATTNSNVTALAGRVTTVEGAVNDLNTSVASKASASDVTALGNRIDGIEAVIPSTATTSNKLATMADVSGGSTVAKRTWSFSTANYSSWEDFLGAVYNYVDTNNLEQNPTLKMSFTSTLGSETTYVVMFPFGGSKLFTGISFNNPASGAVAKFVSGELDMTTVQPNTFKFTIVMYISITANDAPTPNVIDVTNESYPSVTPYSIDLEWLEY